MRNMGTGHKTTPTNIYGYAVFCDGVLCIIKDTRGPERDEFGALVLTDREWTGETFPETEEGHKAAQARTLALNTRSAQ